MGQHGTDALRSFALYYLKLIDTAKGDGMGEASPIGFVLSTKPASSLEFHALEINKHALGEGHSPIQDILLDIAAIGSGIASTYKEES